MPVYNCELYIDDAISSIRGQSFTDFEFVIVNDGSTDGSLDIIHRQAAEDPRIVVLNRPNGGLVDTLNAGIQVCRGKYIARMDGDDIALPGRLEKQVQFLEKHTSVGAVGGWAIIISPNGHELGILKNLTDPDEIFAALSKGNYALLHPTITMRSNLLNKIGGYDSTFRIAEDLDLLLRMSEHCELANLGESVLRYRRAHGSVSDRHRSSYPYYDYLALRKAKLRGRLVNRRDLATLCDRVSWSALLNGDLARAMQFAIKAWAISPGTMIGPKSAARILKFITLRSSLTRRMLSSSES